jgi:glycosyltransferase involved in cell wall biosynthesis
MKIIIAASSGISLVNFRGNLIRDIVRRGHEVYCISSENNDATRTSVERLGAHYIYIPMSRTGTNILEDLKTIIAFWKVISDKKPDMYFAYMSKPITYGGAVARICKVPNINLLVNGLEIAFYRNDLKSRIIRFVLKTCYRFACGAAENVFFQNSDDLNVFETLGIVLKEKCTIVNGSGVDMKYFDKRPLPKEPCVLMTARLIWSKGIREYLRAAEIVKEKMPNVRFILVGGLDQNQESLTDDELRHYIESSVVEYAGYSDDVREYIEQCSVFVLPSYHEGTPRSVLEAMAMGRPIITTNAPGCRETVIDGYNGYLVEVKNHEQLAEKIEHLCNNSESRQIMGDNSYKLCAEKYDVKLVNEVMINKMLV